MERALDALADARSTSADWLDSGGRPRRARSRLRGRSGFRSAALPSADRVRARGSGCPLVREFPVRTFPRATVSTPAISPVSGSLPSTRAAHLAPTMPHDADVGERLEDRVAQGLVPRNEPLRLDVERVDALDVSRQQLVERDLLHVTAARPASEASSVAESRATGIATAESGGTRMGDRTRSSTRAPPPRSRCAREPDPPSAPSASRCARHVGTAPAHRAMRPFGPTAQPADGDAKATLLYAVESTLRHVTPLSIDTSVPVSPTATSVLAQCRDDRHGRDTSGVAALSVSVHVAPPSLVVAIIERRSAGFS